MLDSKSPQEKEVLTPTELAIKAIDDAGLAKRVTRHEFPAMGTLFYSVAVDAPENVHSAIENRVHELEGCWTRFSQNSELMKLNLSHGAPMRVSDDLLILIREMIHGFELTEGVFDPSILGQLMELGFTTDDENLNEQIRENPVVSHSLSDIRIDDESREISLPHGLMLDPGGIGKGLAADLMAQMAISLGASGIAVFAGGEVSVRGQAPTKEGWTIAVENPWDASDFLDTVAVHSGGIATSSMEARSVADVHHILNPVTGQNFATDVVQATVLCERAVDAEVLAKACFAYDCAESISMIEEVGAQALLVDRDGNIHRSHGWEDFT